MRVVSVLMLISLGFLVSLGQTSTPTSVPSGTTIENKAKTKYIDPKTGDKIDGSTPTVMVKVSPVNAIVVSPQETDSSAILPPRKNGQITSFEVCNTGNNPYPPVISSVAQSAGISPSAFYYDFDNSGTVTSADLQISLNEEPNFLLQPQTCIRLLVVFNTENLPAGKNSLISIEVSSADSASGKQVKGVGQRVFENGRGAVVSVEKMVNNSSSIIAENGEVLTYSLRIQNSGDDSARDFVLTDDLLTGQVYQAESFTIDGTSKTDQSGDDEFEISGNLFTVRLKDVPVGSILLKFRVKIDSAVPGAGILNAAKFKASNLLEEGVSTTTRIAVNPQALVFDAENGNTPIANAILTLRENSPTGQIVSLPQTGFPVNASNNNPFTTADNGLFSFALDCESKTYYLEVKKKGFFTRNIKVLATPIQLSNGGCIFNFTVQNLDGQPLANAGSFTLTNSHIVLANLVGFIQHIPLFGAESLSISKVGSKAVAEIGDVITYRIEVKNNSQANSTSVTVEDKLPQGFYYAKNTSKLENKSSTTEISPAISGNVLKFEIGSIPAGQSVFIVYKVRIGANAKTGASINSAQAKTFGEVLSNIATARVDIRPGIDSLVQAIVGKVYLDNDGNGRFTKGDEPLGNAQLITSNGRAVFTDNSGAYSIPRIGAGTQVIMLDHNSVPKSYLPKYHTAEDGEWSRLLRSPLSGGTILTADFPLVKVEEVQTRCCQGTAVLKSSTKSKIKLSDSSSKTALDNKTNAPSKLLTKLPELTKNGVVKNILFGVKRAVEKNEIIRFTLKDGEVITSKITSVGVETIGSYKIRLFANGKEISKEKVGATRTDYNTSYKRETYFGVELFQGKNEFRADVYSATGTFISSRKIKVIVSGPAVRYELKVSKRKLSAGGQDRTEVKVLGFDKDGNPADGEVLVSTSRGYFESSSQQVKSEAKLLGTFGSRSESNGSRNQTRSRVKIKNGKSVQDLILVSDVKSGVADINIHTGNSKFEAATQQVQFVERQEKPLLVGFGQLNVGRANPNSNVFGVDDNVWARASIFTKFKIFGGYFTGSYQSHLNLNRDDYLNQIITNRFSYRNPLFDNGYSTFGDSSQSYMLTPSNAKGFARWEKDLSYVQFGDFIPFSRSGTENQIGSTSSIPEVGEGRPTLATYNRNLTGLSVHLENSKGDVFEVSGARPTTNYGRDILEGGSLSVYSLSSGNILIGSEVVILEIRDRRNPTLILKRETLQRDVDYSLNYEQGRILFKKPISRFDSELNLQQISLFYEYESDSSSNVFIARGLKHFNNRKISLGGSFSATGQGGNTDYFTVFGIDLKAKIGKQGRLFVEFAKSQGELVNPNLTNTGALDGFAVQANLVQPIGRKVNASLTLNYAQDNFANPFGATIQPGSLTLNGDVEVKASEVDLVRFNGGYQNNSYNGFDNRRISVGAAWNRKWNNRFSTIFGYDYRYLKDSTGQFGDRHSHLATAGFSFQATDKLSFSVIREQNLTSDRDPSFPNSTSISANYQINKFNKAFVVSRFGGEITPLTRNTGVGFSAVSSKAEFNVGIESQITPTTSLSGAYRLEEGVSGFGSYAVIGIEQSLKINPKLAFSFGGEGALKVDGTGSNYYGFHAGFTYKPVEDFLANARYERRTRFGSGDYFTVGFVGKPHQDWTVLSNLQYARASEGFDKTLKTGLAGQAGVAWRPIKSDKMAMFLQYNFRDYSQYQRNAFSSQTDGRKVAQIEKHHRLSLETFYNPTPRWSLFGKIAIKSLTDSTNDSLIPVSTLTNLYQARGEYRPIKWMDLGIEGRYLYELKTSTGRYGYAPEIGFWIPKASMRIGLGYNFQQQSKGLFTNDYKRGFYFTITSKSERVFDFLARPDTPSGRKHKRK